MSTKKNCEVIESTVRHYYQAIETGKALLPFFDLSASCQLVVKIGTEAGEFYVGRDAVAAALERTTGEFRENRLESHRLLTQAIGRTGWFSDDVWWSGTGPSGTFSGVTRWSGVLVCRETEWRFVLMHVSEAV